MKTKTLLIAAAAALAAGIMSSQAQVYSQNIVGYVNVPLTPGYTLIANQLDYDGTGTNNSVSTVFGTNLLVGTAVLAWSPSAGGYVSANWINSKGTLKWSGDTNDINVALACGQGVFVQSPATNNLTLVGSVLGGTNVTTLVPGYNLVSSVAPVAGGVTTTLGFEPVVGDVLLTWDPVAQGYDSYNYINSKGTLKWSPSEPQLEVSQAAFIQAVSASTWTNVYNP